MKLIVVASLVILGFLCGQSQAGIRDDFAKALRKVTNAVEEARKETGGVVQTASDTLMAGLDIATDEIVRVNNQLLEEIEKLEAGAGVDVADCTDEQKIVALKDGVIRSLDTVIIDAINGLEALQADTETALQRYSNELGDLTNRMDKCGTTICSSKVLLDTLEIVPKQLAGVTRIVADAVAKTSSTVLATTNTTSRFIAEYTVATYEILDEVRQCINNKIQA